MFEYCPVQEPKVVGKTLKFQVSKLLGNVFEFIFSKSSKNFLSVSIFRLHLHRSSGLQIFREKCLASPLQLKFMLIYLCFYEEIRATYCVSVSVYKIVLSSSNPEAYLEICRRPIMEPNADIALYADLADVTEYNIKNIF